MSIRISIESSLYKYKNIYIILKKILKIEKRITDYKYDKLHTRRYYINLI